MAKRKRTNNDLQNTTYKTKNRVARTQLKTGGELMCSTRVIRFCSTSGIHGVTLFTNPVISHEWRQVEHIVVICDTDVIA
jgi:hypothetical protein